MHPHSKKPPSQSRSATAEDAQQLWHEDWNLCYEADDFYLCYDDSIDPNASTSSQALASFAMLGDVAGLAAALASNPSVELDINGHDRHFQTPLHSAAYSGSVDCVQILLDAGANPRLIDRSGSSPMEIAAASLAPHAGDICRLLASRGALVDEPSLNGFTPFLIACRNASLAPARALVELGANTAVLGPQRQTAYGLAINARGRRGPRRSAGEPNAETNRNNLLDWLESIAERDDIISELAASAACTPIPSRRI